MIKYESGGLHTLFNLGRFHGSVFPHALVVSFPNALITSVLVYMIYDVELVEGLHKDHHSVMNNNAIWGGFSFLVGFLVIFRTSQAYSRFWEGVTTSNKMGSEWFDACSSLFAFCKVATCDAELVLNFQNLLVRLLSMLHAAALGAIEGDEGDEALGLSLELIDADAIDAQALCQVRDSDARVELIYQWIQQLVVENIRNGVLSIAPPILSRCFQEIANGMVHYHEAMKISTVPFPFPYAQTCDALLILHWIIVPFVVCQWVTKAWWAFIFSFMQVFTLWTLNVIAVQLEQPFGRDPNDMDGAEMQLEFNHHLRLLMRRDTKATPQLVHLRGYKDLKQLAEDTSMNKEHFTRASRSFSQIWADLDRRTVTDSSALQAARQLASTQSFATDGTEVQATASREAGALSDEKSGDAERGSAEFMSECPSISIVNTCEGVPSEIHAPMRVCRAVAADSLQALGMTHWQVALEVGGEQARDCSTGAVKAGMPSGAGEKPVQSVAAPTLLINARISLMSDHERSSMKMSSFDSADSLAEVKASANQLPNGADAGKCDSLAQGVPAANSEMGLQQLEIRSDLREGSSRSVHFLETTAKPNACLDSQSNCRPPPTLFFGAKDEDNPSYAASLDFSAADSTPSFQVPLVDHKADGRVNCVVDDQFSHEFAFQDSTTQLGFEVHWVNSGLPFIGRITPDGAADERGVHFGDLLAECNGISTVGKDRQEVLLLLRERPLVLKTIRTPG